jgi:hypothetical protein
MNDGADQGRRYEVRVRGRLDESWFDLPPRVAMLFERQPGDAAVTVLSGELDQAALRGLLTRIWDLNLQVLSVAWSAPVAPDRWRHSRRALR